MQLTDIQQQIHILKSLERDPNMSQRQLASGSGVSLGKVNYCLKKLVNKGFIKVENFKNNNNKLQYVYLLTPRGIKEKSILTKKFLQLKIKEYDKLEAEIEQLQEEIGK